MSIRIYNAITPGATVPIMLDNLLHLFLCHWNDSACWQRPQKVWSHHNFKLFFKGRKQKKGKNNVFQIFQQLQERQFLSLAQSPHSIEEFGILAENSVCTPVSNYPAPPTTFTSSKILICFGAGSDFSRRCHTDVFSSRTWGLERFSCCQRPS